MRYAIARFWLPQHEHHELLIQDAAGKLRRWASQGPPLAAGERLEERPGEGEEVLHYIYDGGAQYGIGGYWTRVEGGPCDLLEEGPERVVVRLHDGRSFALAKTGPTWRLG